MTAPSTTLELAVHAAVAEVDDPEYPGISIVDLGLLESIHLSDVATDTDQTGVTATLGLVPTFSGCPALGAIADDVRAAVENVPGIGEVRVEWLITPVWTIDRVSADARRRMAEEFTVAVEIRGRSGAPSSRCPRCGAETIEQSPFGPSRCRSVHRCPQCSETVEVMRT
ncbi:MAG: iron-sulfur cluster assembly protein [Actinomycetota bacterium]